MVAFWQSWHNYENPQKSLNILYSGCCLPPYKSISLVSNLYFSALLSIFSLGKHVNMYRRWKHLKNLTWYLNFEKNPLKKLPFLPKSDPCKMCSKWAFSSRFWPVLGMVYLSNGPDLVFYYFKFLFSQFLMVLAQFENNIWCPPSNKAGDNTRHDLSSSIRRNY